MEKVKRNALVVFEGHGIKHTRITVFIPEKYCTFKQEMPNMFSNGSSYFYDFPLIDMEKIMNDGFDNAVEFKLGDDCYGNSLQVLSSKDKSIHITVSKLNDN